jgi:Ca2+-binding EF-hand superfamily protein
MRSADADGSGAIDFGEFIQVLTTYCMFTKEDILTCTNISFGLESVTLIVATFCPSIVCFETYDKDGSGSIDEKEFMELCRTVNNAAPMFPGNFARALEEFDR